MQVGDLRAFAAEYNLLADKAIRRFNAGIPATVESLPMATGGRNAGALIAVTTDIIELKDALFIDMAEVDVVRFSALYGSLFHCRPPPAP